MYFSTEMEMPNYNSEAVFFIHHGIRSAVKRAELISGGMYITLGGH
jgi:hypothetical protein